MLPAGTKADIECAVTPGFDGFTDAAPFSAAATRRPGGTVPPGPACSASPLQRAAARRDDDIVEQPPSGDGALAELQHARLVDHAALAWHSEQPRALHPTRKVGSAIALTQSPPGSIESFERSTRLMQPSEAMMRGAAYAMLFEVDKAQALAAAWKPRTGQ